ncbi:Stp1/IreP family PP2C-type Ser/Thr phosphatase [Liquorilactobacillus mali]|uniref:protein-serine/threonine phosphatase n=1 Tax=Liquorilactobacillus mali KCTC 3596 = DSM 20444 TaxID=1046596 RepID=J0KXB2_9LACO|nr:Stp1/IreP family PP2C-type Ser/Thr phosphatase [Liquorilactobacillus mali]EJE98174.1 serine/threonine specific protein phosphatase () [Liquorilactobacillus mali KCTC 3596 = DSM 20444]KRN09436.1 serine threonine specific protein phosphatase [Liquorilactobacillus mali KCTC 3596 = DSM 20444]MDC7951919.1 Stp1/IreP family PP2C-type Ser/Thr phosphatase [Liquorilactobacillus mali]MDV7757133.1 Stp1/IreP family PP2C-type Ser/Thr phosphatase [Liquorilactobacillus mali]QFQ75034.1 Stp1/IreP family PP2C
MNFAYKSDVGEVRPNNEDYVGVFKNIANISFAIVADGLGGHKGGDVASEMAVSHLGFRFEETEIDTIDIAAKWLVDEVQRENKLILERSNQYEDLNGMGTTIVCAIFFGDEVLLANIGDSRGYLLRDSDLMQLTEDHSLVNELLKSGQISSEEARNHPQKNIVTRTLGISENANIDEKIIKIEENDILLLCSDGLTNMVDDQLIKKVLLNNESFADKCDKLIDMANKAGGNDNVTLLLASSSFERRDEQ